MKKALFSAVLVSLIAACGTKNDSSPLNTSVKRFLTAELTDLHLDPQLPVTEPLSASVTIDVYTKDVSVALATCPLNAMCAWNGPLYTAKIVRETQDACRVKTIEARTDGRPVDGALVEIIVVDNSRSICDRIYTYMTEVELKTSIVNRMTGEESSTRSTLNGLESLR